MNHQVSTKLNYTNDVNLIEVLTLLIKEKKTVLTTFFIIMLLTFSVALYEMQVSKKASAIFTVRESYTEQNIMIPSVLEKVYRDNNIRDKNGLFLDEFKTKFKITEIIPKDVENKREFLSKNAESLNYIPTSYRVDLRVGSIKESEKILKDYYNSLNEYYRYENESKYKFKYLDPEILDDNRYDYKDYLQIVEQRKQALKTLIDKRENTRVDYLSYGFGYRKVQIALNNLETIEIQNLKNYLLTTSIVKNPQKFQNEFINKKIMLENRIKEEEGNSKNYKILLESYENEEPNIIAPKGIKITMGDNQKEKYQTEVMEGYLQTESILASLKQQLSELIYINKTLKIETEAEKMYILKSLTDIIKSYNDIVFEVNVLEAKENYIENGAIIKLASPIEVTSTSKVKLIIIGGIGLGIVLGIVVAFFKNFLDCLKRANKEIALLVMFIFIGTNSYSKEKVTLQFTHKEIIFGLNPDKTPFDLDKILLNEFLGKELGVKAQELKESSIKQVFLKNSTGNVEEKLKMGDKNYIYFPTEYILNLDNITNAKEIKEKIIKNFPNFYINYFLQNTSFKYNYLESYNSYSDILKAFNNSTEQLLIEINLRRENSTIKERFYEYNNLYLELNKIKNILYEDAENYIKSNYIADDFILESNLLNGQNKYLDLELDFLKNKSKVYEEILKNYNIDKKQITLLENGDISLNSDVSFKEKQYINISKTHLNNLKKQNKLQIQIFENKRLMNSFKNSTKEQKRIINQKLLNIQDELNEILDKMAEIELKDYKEKYGDCIIVF